MPNSMESWEKQNVNISAYRVLYILLLLVQHQSMRMTTLNKHLYENPLIQRTYNSETITKYINTLRKVGCHIPRSSSRYGYHYVLQENPFPLRADDDEIEVACKLLSLLSGQSDESLHVGYHDFLQKAAWMLDSDQKQKLLEQIEDILPPLSVQQRRTLLKQYKEYCMDALVLDLDYKLDGMQKEHFIVEPLRVVQEGKQIFLLGSDRINKSQVKLNIENITACRQMHSKIHSASHTTTVTFQLYGRLAKTYRLYPGEEVVFQYGETLQIKAKIDDVQGLMSRLLKYNHNCQVISPAPIRQQMHSHIKQLIKVLAD